MNACEMNDESPEELLVSNVTPSAIENVKHTFRCTVARLSFLRNPTLMLLYSMRRSQKFGFERFANSLMDCLPE